MNEKLLVPIEPTQNMLDYGMCALLQCTITELGDYSEPLIDRYLDDCKRIYKAMAQAASVIKDKS